LKGAKLIIRQLKRRRQGVKEIWRERNNGKEKRMMERESKKVMG